ncbi:MAG TPA: antitoxin VapB family protein [Vicinamibacteria bacterium]|nr:antitoxin VapB family protein [Vicinamibacteria bacterium]
MATKTITLELDAYEKLKRAKRGPRESFSSVVRRARWDDSSTAGHLLGALRDVCRLHPESLLDEDALARVDERASSRGRRPRATATAE